MVATITLNRPETMNALTLKTYVEIEQAIVEADNDNDVRAVVITGAGRGFCSGDDLNASAWSAGSNQDRLGKLEL